MLMLFAEVVDAPGGGLASACGRYLRQPSKGPGEPLATLGSHRSS